MQNNNKIKLLGRKTGGRKTKEESEWQMLAVKETAVSGAHLRTCGPGEHSLKGHLTCYLWQSIEHSRIQCHVHVL